MFQTSLNVAELPGLVWEYLTHHYSSTIRADSSSPVYQPHPENPTKDLQTSPSVS